MLHCLNTSGNVAGSSSDMTVLEKQMARMKSQQEHLHHQHQAYFTGFNGNGSAVFSSSLQLENSQGSMTMMIAADSGSIKHDPALENGWTRMGFGSSGSPTSPGFVVNSVISRTGSCPPALAATAVAEANHNHKDTDLGKMMNSSIGKESFKKRKADKAQDTKVVAENDGKRIKVGADDGESKITGQTSIIKNNNNRVSETCADTSKANSKASEVQNPDYIHVRARRGQATDSHSLAERVRREKISERMKYLQDLVPGCNKITGKAGMLDEIINYVQSLQRQVEFLSMKLAAVNPSPDFNIDDLFAKEVFPACAASFPTIGMSSDMTNPAYLHFNSPQQIVLGCGLDAGINLPDMELRRTISAPLSMPETFLGTSSFSQILPSSAWEGDFQNLYNVAFDQARATSFPSQLFTGLVEAGNLKMEM